ncbi:MAG: DUF5688 family protein [Agathobacter sp.]|nr:DUF5688 family protein [Agathobacter sp.]
MNYQDFISCVTEFMQEHISDSATIQLKEIQKNNGTTMEGMLIFEKGLNIAPTIYLLPYYSRLLEGVELQEILDDILRTYRKYRPNQSIDVSFFVDYKRVKPRVVYKLINHHKNQKFLEDVPHIDYLDFAIVFLYLIDGSKENYSTILIHNNHMELWGICKEDLYEAAMENTPRLLPFELLSLWDYVKGFNPFLFFTDTSAPELFILTNPAKLNGASCLLYPDLMEQCAQMMESDFFVIPSSIHELLLYPHSNTEDLDSQSELTALIQEVNDTQLQDEDILSDHVYYYSRRKHSLVG